MKLYDKCYIILYAYILHIYAGRAKKISEVNDGSFQKKKTYVNTSFNNLTTSYNETYAADAAYTSSYTYSFEDGVLLSAFSNAP